MREVYHLKAAGQNNWPKMREAISRRSKRRARAGLRDHRRHVYLHGRRDRPRCRHAAVGAGGRPRRVGRAPEEAGDPQARAARRCASRRATGRACICAAGSPERVLLIGFKTEKLKPLTGKTLAEVAKMRGRIARGRGDRPRDRGSHACRHRVLPDVRREREARPVAAVGRASARMPRRRRRRARSC